MAMTDRLNMLLVEPATLLRRTVALTARSLGLANVHEAASHALALRLLKDTAFDGALIAFDSAHLVEQADGASAIGLLDQVRAGSTASRTTIPIAVMIDQCDAATLAALRARGVSRVLLKPFKARNLVDTFVTFAQQDAPPQPGVLRIDEG
jgi:CheY-like chemotaxis protein